MTKAKAKKSHWLVSTFGTLGYISCLLQWLWAGIVFVPLLLENQIIRGLLLPSSPTQEKVIVQQATEPNIFLMIIAVFITIVVVVLSAVMLIRLPFSIAKTGKKAASTTARAIVPAITHHRKLPPKKQRVLTAKIVMYLKFSASIAPVLLLLVVYLVDTELPKDVVLTVGSILAIGTLLWFSLEYVCAKTMGVSLDKIL
ncbi:MAG TPA: hypothetical protein VGE34_03410 [Candidatus Saccharimonadales bacterium]